MNDGQLGLERGGFQGVGLREAFLLLIGAGFASQMFNLAIVAVSCGVAAVAVWVLAMTRQQRPTWLSTLALGGGLIVTFVWWPDDGLAPFAIALLWIGVALAVGAATAGVMTKRR